MEIEIKAGGGMEGSIGTDLNVEDWRPPRLELPLAEVPADLLALSVKVCTLLHT